MSCFHEKHDQGKKPVICCDYQMCNYGDHGKLEPRSTQVQYMAGSGYPQCARLVLMCVCLQVGLYFCACKTGNQLFERGSQWRADLHIHLSFKTPVNESNLIISPERIYNCIRLVYGRAALLKISRCEFYEFLYLQR